jgi:hypothetical protein
MIDATHVGKTKKADADENANRDPELRSLIPETDWGSRRLHETERLRLGKSRDEIAPK